MKVVRRIHWEDFGSVTVRRLFHIFTWTSTSYTLAINGHYYSFSCFLVLVLPLDRHVAATVLTVSLIPLTNSATIFLPILAYQIQFQSFSMKNTKYMNALKLINTFMTQTGVVLVLRTATCFKPSGVLHLQGQQCPSNHYSSDYSLRY